MSRALVTALILCASMAGASEQVGCAPVQVDETRRLALMEAVRRRPVNVRVLEYIQVVCVVALMGFMLFVTFFDTTDIFGDNKKAEAPPKPSFRGVEKVEPAAEVVPAP